jgi:predicted Zn-dependent protease
LSDSAKHLAAHRKPQRGRREGELWLLAIVAAAFVLAFTQFSDAQTGRGKGPPLIRDAEIEALLKDYTAPLFKAAGFGSGAVDVYIVEDDRFNAFVTGRRMFINSGAIKISESPGEIIGVLAHETGHIIGGHQARLRDRVDKANVLAILSMLAGAGLAVAGGEAGEAAGQAIAMGGQSAILRDLLAYQRSEEAAADNTAITLLNKTGQSARGMIATFERFQQNMMFSGSRVDPYLTSHPMPRERIALLEKLAAESPYYDREIPDSLRLRHDMVRAKIAAYGGNGGDLQSMFRDNPQGPAARYGLAIALFLRGSNRDAVPIINQLIKEQPSNPYLYEMRGEMLMRGGRADLAVADFKKALSLDKHNSGLMRVELGHALLETRDPKLTGEAERQIKAGVAVDPTSPRGYGLLARSYGQQGEPDLARAAAAQEAYYQFRFKEAKQLAHLAQPNLKHGSPEWLRMQDIIDYKPPKKF